MTDEQFWQLIALLDASQIDAAAKSSDEPITSTLVQVLAKMGDDSIRAFDNQLAHKLWLLDGSAYAQFAGVSGQYEDLFLYARCCIVGSGQEAFEAVLADASLMPDGLEFELLLSVPERAWELIHDSEYHHVPKHALDMGANKENWSNS